MAKSSVSDPMTFARMSCTPTACLMAGFRTGGKARQRHQWKANGRKLNHEERERADAEIKATKAQRDADKAECHANASEKAERIWNASTPAREDHPYLVHKRVKPHGLHEYKGALVVPIWHDGKIVGVQFIDPDGSKRFLKGNQQGVYYVIGEIEHADRVCIAEGFATAATIYEATGIACAVAFDAGNLLPVAKAIKLSLPGVKLTVAADDDWKRVNPQTGEPENIGLHKSQRGCPSHRRALGRAGFPRMLASG